MSRNDPLKYGIWGLTLSPDWIHHMLTATMQSVIRQTLLHGRIHSRTRGYKWSLLKVREGNYKREHGGPQWNLEAERACFSSPGAFKIYAHLWEEPGDSQPIINEWGGARVVPGQMRVVQAIPESGHG
jgi:hypothetical protein